jgi:hypothetical protein
LRLVPKDIDVSPEVKDWLEKVSERFLPTDEDYFGMLQDQAIFGSCMMKWDETGKILRVPPEEWVNTQERINQAWDELENG